MELLVQYLKELGAFKLFAMISGFLIIIGTFVLFSTHSTVNEMIPLYSNLELTDSQKIVTDLESKEIPYQLRANGTEILVPADKVLRLRMSMASQGFPSKGSIVGYEIFDKSDMMGTSNFVQNVNLIRALEGELARTIGSFASVENARVHLVMPKKELFSREASEPSASVVLKMYGNNKLTKDQINAVVHLVATAVGGLDTKNITVVDTAGRSLKLGMRETDDATMIASSSEEFRIAYENRLKNTIEELIEQSVGLGKVKAQVSAEINFDRVVTNSETYDPDGQVVRSVKESEDKESTNEKDAGTTSVANNIPNASTTANSQPVAISSTEHTDTVTNYEISKTIKNHVSETGTIKKLSIAVLVDGTYQYDKDTKKLTYIPRNDEELNKYATLIKSAVGFDATRNDIVEVVNMSFVQDPLEFEDQNMIRLKSELPSIIQTFVIGAVVVIILLMVVRPIAIRAFEATKHDMAEAESQEDLLSDVVEAMPDIIPTADQEPLIDIAKIEARFKGNGGYKPVNDLVAKYPQESLNVMRKWINKN